MLRLLPPLLAALVAAGCGRPHDLGTDTSTSSSSAGSGGAGAGGAGGGDSTSSTTVTVGSGGSGGGGVVEPSGPTELTVVNGINDYPAARFCFLPNDTPWPAAPSGLAFAASQVASPLASAIPTDGDVTPWVIAGDLSATAGQTCTQILALAASGGDGGAPPIVAQALGVIPKVVWGSNKSLLLATSGCLGGAGHDDPNAKIACGMTYSTSTPTAGAALVAMSRLPDASHVSLQAVSASPALPEVDVSVLPNLMDAMPRVVAHSLSQGAIGPKPPFTALALGDFGMLDGVQIQTYTPNTMYMTSAVPLSAVFANGGVGAAGFVNGASLVLVAVGSGPGLPTSSWWHALTYVLVKAEPG